MSTDAAPAETESPPLASPVEAQDSHAPPALKVQSTVKIDGEDVKVLELLELAQARKASGLRCRDGCEGQGARIVRRGGRRMMEVCACAIEEWRSSRGPLPVVAPVEPARVVRSRITPPGIVQKVERLEHALRAARAHVEEVKATHADDVQATEARLQALRAQAAGVADAVEQVGRTRETLRAEIADLEAALSELREDLVRCDHLEGEIRAGAAAAEAEAPRLATVLEHLRGDIARRLAVPLKRAEDLERRLNTVLAYHPEAQAGNARPVA